MIDYTLFGLTIAVLVAGVAWACLSANPHKRRQNEAEETGGDVERQDDVAPPRRAGGERLPPIDSSRWPATSAPRPARLD
jgi:hypothetical protein